MLFTDIEGSTALVTRLGDRYGEALSAQRAILRRAFAAHAGRELGTAGDGFFAVFESAGDAALCCLAAQRALSAQDWPGGAPVRVRMGLHSGEPVRHEGDYVGLDVHRAARIGAAAHGGQVLVSEPARLLAEPRLPAEAALRDLGLHRLKDIKAPERLYQLVAPGLEERFPPPRSLGTPASLPVAMTPLVGRGRDLERLCSVVARPGVRLVTLTGAGGVGKTRLAVAAAASMGEAFDHGVFFVPLAAVGEAGEMWAAIAGSVGVNGAGPAAETVARYLADRRSLLALDNIEQLDGAAGVVATLLQTAPRLVILATSRRPLHLLGEHDYPVPPLGLPDGSGAAEAAASGAVTMFIQHAEMARPGFTLTPGNAADIVAVCRRLDGLPLGIELAAARVKLLSPRALRARLGRSLDLAAADARRPSRQQTIRATIAWSYDLLTSESQTVLRRAGVFAGGCDLDALAAVALTEPGPADADSLGLAAELLDVSLITVAEGPDGEPRVSLLETVHDYALERLEQAGELDQTRQRHALYYARFADREQAQLYGPAHLAALDRLEADHDNMAAALRWSLDTAATGPAAAERAAVGIRLVDALTAFWYQHGYIAEGRRWLQRALQVIPDDARAPLARVADGLAALLGQQGEFAAAAPLHERSLAIWRELGDREQQAIVLNGLGIVHRRRGDLQAARSALEESVALSRELGHPRFVLTAALTNLGLTEHEAGHPGRAVQLLQEALDLAERTGDAYAAAHVRLSLAKTSLRAGRVTEAQEQLAAILGYIVGAGNTDLLATALELSACTAAGRGANLRAARLAGAADAVRQQTDMPRPAEDAVLLEQFLAPARASTTPRTWDSEFTAGRAFTQQDATALLPGPPAPQTQ